MDCIIPEQAVCKKKDQTKTIPPAIRKAGIQSPRLGMIAGEFFLTLYPLRYNINLEKGAQEVLAMNRIAQFIRESRKAAGLTQEEFAARSGLGLRFVRELEQGKPTVRMDKVNTALGMFGMEAVPGRKDAD